MKRTLQITAAIAYLMAGLFTFAYVYQRVDLSKQSPVMNEAEYRSVPAIGAGAIWPIYWTGHWAFKLTQPEVLP